MRPLKIGVIATHFFPIPHVNLHTGDQVIIDLCCSLDEMGHAVDFYAPKGSYCPLNGRQFPIKASYGKGTPDATDCEEDCFNLYHDFLRQYDIVHDFSVEKHVSEILYQEGRHNVIQTIMGGAWQRLYPPRNLITWSQTHRDRVLRGASDYEGTHTPDLAGHTGKPVAGAHVVHGGIDTDFYTPSYDKKDFFLWMGRWHEVRGYRQAIQLAQKTGINLIMAGEHPDNELFEYQKNCALEAVAMAKNHSNITFQWLPQDPHHHTAKRTLYRQAKAFILTTQFQEPFGLSQVEALACGTPVISTNYGSMPEIIIDGITGYIRKNDVEDLAEAVSKINNIDVRNCRSDAVKRFDRRVMALAYCNEYDEVINGNQW